jgi:hypothetical protein
MAVCELVRRGKGSCTSCRDEKVDLWVSRPSSDRVRERLLY